MATLYISKMGETVDIICQKHYGRTESVTEMVLASNPGISLNVILPLGTEVKLPRYEEPDFTDKLIQLWG